MKEFHFWIYGRNPDDGKVFLIYGCPARQGEDHCRQLALEMLGGMDFKMRRLDTRDIASASRQIKGQRLATTHDLTKSTKRLGHNKTIRRSRIKRQKGWFGQG